MIPLFKVAMAHEATHAVTKTLQSGYIGEGERVKALEIKFGEMLGTNLPLILATNSCTSALDLAYHLLDLDDVKDIVISTPMTFLATNMSLELRGVEIIWADIDPRTGNLDPKCLPQIIDEYGGYVKAVVCTDWAGRSCDYNEIRRVAPGIPIIEDAAHAFDAKYDGMQLPAFGGDYIAWSFQAIKHLTTGDGGMLKVPASQYQRARLLRWYGRDREDSRAMRCLQQASEPGFKYQMNDIAASIGLANFEQAQANVREHRNVARYYDRFLPDSIIAPFDPGASYWIYTILVDDPAHFEEYMLARDIQVSQVHTRNDMQECLPDPVFPLPGLDFFQSHMVSIPCGWWLTKVDIEKIVKIVTDYVKVPVHA